MRPENKKVYVLRTAKTSATNKPKTLAPSSKEFLDIPAPEIVFEGRSFCFTGVFDFANGDRNQCNAATEAQGGFCYERPNRALDYLVVGNYAEPSWGHGSFGRKIKAVIDFKISGAKCQIVSEEHWRKNLKNISHAPQSREQLVQGHSKNHQLIQLQRDLDRLRKNQQILVTALRKELTPSTYFKLTEHLRDLGVVI